MPSSAFSARHLQGPERDGDEAGQRPEAERDGPGATRGGLERDGQTSGKRSASTERHDIEAGHEACLPCVVALDETRHGDVEARDGDSGDQRPESEGLPAPLMLESRAFRIVSEGSLYEQRNGDRRRMARSFAEAVVLFETPDEYEIVYWSTQAPGTGN